MNKYFISLQNIKLSYNNNLLLDNEKLVLFNNQSLLIVGTNGCGKTSMLNLIAGLYINNNATFKAIYQDKTYINTIPQDFIKQTAYLFQDIFKCFNPLYKISKQINMDNLDNDLLKIFCVNNLNKYPYEYSGGELQKILLCIVLSQKSNLYLLDEPTNYLDFSTKQILGDVIVDYQKKHKSFLIATHCPYLIQQFNTNIFTINNAKLILYKPSEKLTNSYVAFVNKDSLNIILKNYTLCIKNNILVKNISYKLDASAITILTGENGVGKSSFAFSLSKIYTNIYTINGEILIDKNIKITYLFQNYSQSINLPFKVRSILLDSFNNKLSLFNKYKKILTLFKKLNLDKNILTKYPYNLSGGEQQKILLIRGLLNDTNFFILDETISAQDTKSKKLIIDLIKDYNQKYKIGFLIISHQNLNSYFLNAKVIELKNKKLNEIPNK